MSHAADICQTWDDRLLGARRWYLFSENDRESIMNGPAMLSGGEMLAATLPVWTLQILDVGAVELVGSLRAQLRSVCGLTAQP